MRRDANHPPTVAASTAQSKHMEDEDMQRKERAFSPMSKAYYAAVRTGLCNAYLAASVVGSNLVRTSKTGGMGMVSADWPRGFEDLFVRAYTKHMRRVLFSSP